MTRILRVLSALALAASPLTRAATPLVEDAALAAGIALAREGDFQGALLRLDEAVRRLETAEAPARELAQGYLYLGISYLELGQEMPALERFRAAVLRDPDLRLDPAEFSPQVIRFFEAARQEVAAMRAPAAAPPASPPKPTPAPTARERKGSGKKTSHLDASGARGQIVFDGALVTAGQGGRARANVAAGGRHRIEGVLVGAASRPGTWRFELPGIRPGSLQVAAGTVAVRTGNVVVFRLAGREGESIAFSFDTP
ncbi:MAG TPA: hypothetical protein VMT87_10990 [Vicinamibacteria bacterium]|nr:hypothetical protein [Vicinamibacteria bacterium]